MYSVICGPVYKGKTGSISSNSYRAFEVVAVAASAGGVQALQSLLAGLPSYFPAPLIIVQHLPPRSTYVSCLDWLLQRKTELRVKWVRDGESLLPGTVYLAPQDSATLLVEESRRLKVVKLRRPQRIKPAADPLFQSVAQVFGERALALVLSGALSDGAEGAARIAAAGGRVLTQRAEDAEYPYMPNAALKRCCTGPAFDAHALAHVVRSLVMAPGAAALFNIGKSGAPGGSWQASLDC
jgi:two-component system chemotaxis response regulator CheB